MLHRPTARADPSLMLRSRAANLADASSTEERTKLQAVAAGAARLARRLTATSVRDCESVAVSAVILVLLPGAVNRRRHESTGLVDGAPFPCGVFPVGLATGPTIIKHCPH